MTNSWVIKGEKYKLDEELLLLSPKIGAQLQSHIFREKQVVEPAERAEKQTEGREFLPARSLRSPLAQRRFNSRTFTPSARTITVAFPCCDTVICLQLLASTQEARRAYCAQR